MVPHFSIITPMYNRAHTIQRAIDSCLAQTAPDFELLIVDDCSSDDSATIVAGYQDPRVRLLQHASNRGPCPARNTAIAEARGEWCVMLDSDFALLPHALEHLRQRTSAAPADIGNVASSCAWDTGRITPYPPVSTRVLDFPAYLRWIERVSVSEKLECIRRSVFGAIRYPDSRAWEFEFHLDLASQWKMELSDEVLVQVYSDAHNRLTAAAGPQAVARVLQDAPDKLASFERALVKHGTALRRWTPQLHDYLHVLAATQATYTGERRRALRHASRVLRRQPLSLTGWAAAGLALLSPGTAARAVVERRRRRA